MNWFFIALVNPIAHAFANHLDKHIISRFLHDREVGALILLTQFFAVIVIPIILIINPTVFTAMPLRNALILIVNGSFIGIATICYYYALESHEASYVVPLFQLIPVFGFILGYLILGETLKASQIIGSLMIITGGISLSFRYVRGKLGVHNRLLLLMGGCTFFYALYSVVFKYVAVEQGFMHSLFWDTVGKLVLGAILFIAIKSYRRDFLHLVKNHHKSIIGLSLFTEALALIGEIALILAVLYAPVALVQSVGGFQAVFVLLLGVLITVFFPRMGRESLERTPLLQKIMSTAVITAGVYFLTIH